jgi:hypothetical protein
VTPLVPGDGDANLYRLVVENISLVQGWENILLPGTSCEHPTRGPEVAFFTTTPGTTFIHEKHFSILIG